MPATDADESALDGSEGREMDRDETPTEESTAHDLTDPGPESTSYREGFALSGDTPNADFLAPSAPVAPDPTEPEPHRSIDFATNERTTLAGWAAAKADLAAAEARASVLISESYARADEVRSRGRTEAREIIQRAEARAQQIIELSVSEAAGILRRARQQADAIVAEAQLALDAFVDDYGPQEAEPTPIVEERLARPTVSAEPAAEFAQPEETPLAAPVAHELVAAADREPAAGDGPAPLLLSPLPFEGNRARYRVTGQLTFARVMALEQALRGLQDVESAVVTPESSEEACIAFISPHPGETVESLLTVPGLALQMAAS
ncbi:MAG TPA: hypothetical protein VFC51_18075 [Chloroflexota bacterium]|nr:hypothetical protein [Chloroflexota bacterium]